LPFLSKSPVAAVSSTYHDRCFQPIVVESRPGNSATIGPVDSGTTRSSDLRTKPGSVPSSSATSIAPTDASAVLTLVFVRPVHHVMSVTVAGPNDAR